MPLLSLLLFGLWALLCVRVICYRTTLSTRTLLTFLVLGTAMGPVVTAVAEKFFNEYSWTGGPAYFIAINACKQLMLLVPLLWLLLRPAWRDSSSVTDAFLAAFAIGFGYDLGASVITSAGSQSVTGFSFLPPGIYSGSAANVTGYGWWIGAVMLALVMTWRIFGKAWLSYAVAGVILLLCAVDQTLLMVYSSEVPKWWETITFNRSAAPYVCLIFLVACAVVESLRIKARAVPGSLLSEYQAILTKCIAFRFQEARRLSTQFRIGRQLDVVRAEQQHRPGDSVLAALKTSLEGQLQLAQQPLNSATSLGIKNFLRRRVPYVVFGALAFLLIIVASSPFAQPFGSKVWQWFVFTDKFAPFQLNIVGSVLLAWLTWAYLTAPPAAYRGVRADESAQFYAERAIVLTGFAVFLVVCIYEVPVPSSFALPSPIEFVSFATPFTVAAGIASSAPSDPAQANHWITVLLLVLCAATGMTARRWELWSAAPQPLRLKTSVRHLLTVLRVSTVAWLSLMLFTYLQIVAHLWFAKIVARNWNPAQHSALGLDIKNWNSALGLISALASIPGVLAFVWLSAWMNRRAQKFLLDESPAAASATAAETSRAVGGA
jgi:hypothetical protein